MLHTSRYLRALTLAFAAHGDQIRKGTGVPYTTHLLAVSSLVGEYGGDEDQMIAGLLHDTLEDCPHRVSVELLRKDFGWRVARIVLGCSDCLEHPKPPWEERKQSFLSRLASEPRDTWMVVAADKLHNTRALVRDLRILGPEMWSRFRAPAHRQLWFLEQCVDAMAPGLPPPLAGDLSFEVARLRQQVVGAATQEP